MKEKLLKLKERIYNRIEIIKNYISNNGLSILIIFFCISVMVTNQEKVIENYKRLEGSVVSGYINFRELEINQNFNKYLSSFFQSKKNDEKSDLINKEDIIANNIYSRINENKKEVVNSKVSIEKKQGENKAEKIDKLENELIKNNNIQFFSQAPKGWNVITEDTCENASVLNGLNYLLNLNFTEDTYYSKLLELEDYKVGRFKSKSISVLELKAVVNKFFGNKNSDIYMFGKDVNQNALFTKIKEEINKGNLIVFPANGKVLNNPFFSGEGPNYHMILIKGYDEKGNIYTNDVGTKNGENFKYTIKNIFDAFGDYKNNEKNILILKK